MGSPALPPSGAIYGGLRLAYRRCLPSELCSATPPAHVFFVNGTPALGIEPGSELWTACVSVFGVEPTEMRLNWRPAVEPDGE